MLITKRGLLISVVAATALMLCRGMDTSTSSTNNDTTSPSTTTDSVHTTTIFQDISSSNPPTTRATTHDDTTANQPTTLVAQTTTIATTVPTSVLTTSTATSLATSATQILTTADSNVPDNSNNAVNTITNDDVARSANVAAGNVNIETTTVNDVQTSTPSPDFAARNDLTDSKKCSYKFLNKNKFNPQTAKYDNMTAAMEEAFAKSPLAQHVFNKYLDPKPQTASAVHEVPLPTSNLGGINPDSDIPHLSADTHQDSKPSHQKSPNILSKIQETPRDFDVNKMFDQISNNANGFSHPISKFNGLIRPNRPIGFHSNFLKPSENTGFLNSFDSIFRRRKRMAVPPPPSVYSQQKPKSVCEPDRHVMTGFYKDNKLCYVYKPEAQGIEMDKCVQTDCNVCSEHGSAQCVAQHLSAWVWTYCPHIGEVITPEYIEYPAYCSCMVIQC